MKNKIKNFFFIKFFIIILIYFKNSLKIQVISLLKLNK